MTREEHRAEAIRLLKQADNTPGNAKNYLIARAQVHAILALTATVKIPYTGVG